MSAQKSLDEEIERIDGNVNGLFAKVSDLTDRVEELEDELAEERSKRKALEGEVNTAIGTARAVDDGARADGGPTKQERARWLSRDEVIRLTVERSNTGPRNAHGNRSEQIGSVTNKDVQQMAKPETDLKWATVDEAWKDLVRRWDAFVVDDTGDVKTLTLNSVDDVSDALVGVVEESLGRDDLANRFVGGGD